MATGNILLRSGSLAKKNVRLELVKLRQQVHDGLLGRNGRAVRYAADGVDGLGGYAHFRAAEVRGLRAVDSRARDEAAV